MYKFETINFPSEFLEVRSNLPAFQTALFYGRDKRLIKTISRFILLHFVTI